MTNFVLCRCPLVFLGLIFVPVLFANTEQRIEKLEKLEEIRSIPHSGYSEGLDFHDGFLWNAFPREIRKIDPKDGTILGVFKPATEYSESIQWFKGVLWNVSFTDNSIHAGKVDRLRASFEKKGTVPEVHAWGMTHDGTNLIVTGDYSSKLYFISPKTVKVVRTIEVNEKDLEDLAWDGKWIWSSSFTQSRGQIFNIDPKSGKVGRHYSLPKPDECPIIDGIAYDGKNLWITGKECPKIYCVKLPK